MLPNYNFNDDFYKDVSIYGNLDWLMRYYFDELVNKG